MSVKTQTVIRILVLALAYFAAGWLGLRIPYTGTHITLVWLPTGIAVAALIRWGASVWPGIYLGAFLVNLAIGSSPSLAVGIAVGNTLGPMLAAIGLGRMEFHPAFDRRKDVGSFIAAACVGMMASASGGVASLHLAGLLPLETMGAAWLTWWMGDAVGVLLAAPFLLSLGRGRMEQLRRNRKELLLWILIGGVVVWLAFVQDYQGTRNSLPLAFLTLPVLAWAALRFGNTGTALATLGCSVVAAWSTTNGHGPFALADGHARLFLLWSYMATTVLTGSLITALQAERVLVEKNLRESEEKVRGLFELSPLGIALVDMTGRFVEFNEAFRNICGYSAEELKSLDYWTLTPRKYEADEARQLESLERSGRYGPYEKEYVRKDGSRVPLRLNGMLITGNDGRKYIWSIVENIADRRRTEEDLRIAATAFEAQVGIIVTDPEGVILRVNRAFTEDTGYSAEEAIGQTPRLLKSGRHDTAFYAAMWDSIQHKGGWQGEIWDRRKSGEIYPKWMTITAVKGDDGTTKDYVCTQSDITDRKAKEDEIRHLAFYDPLTHLPNRRLLRDRLHHALAASHRSRKQGALLFIDLDNFKTLNDTLGHDKGDLLLQQVGQRLASCVREEDTVARLGGDEFVVMLESLSHKSNEAAAQAEMVGEKILATLNQNYLLDGHDYRSTPSIGVTLFGNQHESMEELLKQADLAMYQAKAAGRNALRFFDPEMQSAVTARVALEADLRQAVREGQFLLYYQAQVEERERLTGAEVLVRWRHPQRGMVFPGDFIALAEETGLILPLGLWVLEMACAQLAAWALSPDTTRLTLAVNVSAHQLRQPNFVEQVLAVLESSGADPEKLKLELTESELMDNVEDTIAKMTALKDRGVGFALDDFGTGYSSLAYLKRLPLEKLKIDRSFVMDVLTDPNDAVIATTIVALARSLGLEVIAEGVETEEQRTFLAQNGCHAYQGYLFSRPLPLDAFEALVRERSASAPA
ncbi:MAG: EAL domain-containing protein [Rhodocyclaceae bacterium]|nr:EAL domain-containing protein [Rhodocyclaceae bacterium]